MSNRQVLRFVCCHCGYVLDTTQFYLDRLVNSRVCRDLRCPACKRSDGWKKTIMTRSVEDIHKAMRAKGLDPELYKSLLICEHRQKFKGGKYELNQRYKRYYANIKDSDPVRKRILLGLVKGDVPEEVK